MGSALVDGRDLGVGIPDGVGMQKGVLWELGGQSVERGQDAAMDNKEALQAAGQAGAIVGRPSCGTALSPVESEAGLLRAHRAPGKGQRKLSPPQHR